MSDIKVFPQDKPISVVSGGPDASMPYGVVNVHGMRIAQFATEEEARACADEANKSEETSEPEQQEPEIESEPEPEPEPEAVETTQQKHDKPRAARKKAVTKTKGRTMPRTAKKKKATVKKRAKAAAKKTVQKVMKRRKKKKAAY